jgi:hypothetical protein
MVNAPNADLSMVPDVLKAWNRRAPDAEAEVKQARIDAQAQSCVPDGWKLVPIEPTAEMIDAAANADPERESVWAAYLAASPQPQPVQPTQAAIDVLAERQRQISSEGWTPEHDDEHSEGELSLAAAGYAESASDQIQCVDKAMDESTLDDSGSAPSRFPHHWAFKAATPRRMLVKAGALILAEIERLDRAAPQPKD